MKLVFFVHSVAADWNHGNAHFLRGLLSALARAGHEVEAWEPRGAWSLENMVRDGGAEPVVAFARAFPEIEVRSYDVGSPRLIEIVDRATADADAVLVHEFNEPRLVGAVGHVRRRRDFALLFHDTHHRPWSCPDQIAQFNLSAYDGVLAFGEALREIYVERFGVRRAWTFHEAADHLRFRPLERPREQDVVWIGNWGDGERTDELRRYWLDAARSLPELRFVGYGVRYPDEAERELADAGIEYRGWAASLDVPEIFARSAVTLHVPRAAYRTALPGIPTIRIFEALACGIPLVSAPWRDAEGLFRPGDFVVTTSPREMREALHRFATDDDARREQAERGLETILARHTCEHRAEQLLDILAALGREGAAGVHRSTLEVQA